MNREGGRKKEKIEKGGKEKGSEEGRREGKQGGRTK